jgi:cathepsin D
MGLAFQSISEYNAPPTFQNLVSQGEVREPIFSFKLAPDGSELFLGGANPELYKGYFTWVDLTTKVCHLPKVVNLM